MAWLQVHQSLPTHRKTLAAADALDITPTEMVGHLVAFWLWALDNATDGRLAGVSERTIARAANWPGDPPTFVCTLQDAGFLDITEDGLAIHDWDQYTGRLADKRKLNAERQRKFREQHNALVTRDVTVTSRDRVEKNREEKSTRVTSLRGESDDSPLAEVSTVLDKPVDTPKPNGKVHSSTEPSSTKTPANAEQFAALAQVCGYDLQHLTKPARSELNAAAKHFADAGFDGQAIECAAAEYRRRWPKMEITPSALVKHASRLRSPPTPKFKQPARSVWDYTDEELAKGVNPYADDA